MGQTKSKYREWWTGSKKDTASILKLKFQFFFFSETPRIVNSHEFTKQCTVNCLKVSCKILNIWISHSCFFHSRNKRTSWISARLEKVPTLEHSKRISAQCANSSIYGIYVLHRFSIGNSSIFAISNPFLQSNTFFSKLFNFLFTLHGFSFIPFHTKVNYVDTYEGSQILPGYKLDEITQTFGSHYLKPAYSIRPPLGAYQIW